MRRFLAGCFLVALGAASYAGTPTPPPAGNQAAPAPEQKTSEDFAYATYKEKSGPFTMLVYSWPALWRETEPFFPLVVAVGRGGEKHQKGETPEEKQEDRALVIVQLNDFELTDSQGKVYPPATYDQILAQYKFLPDDKNMLAQEPMVTTGAFPESSPMSLAFYPVDGGARLRSTEAELDESTCFESTIYFPRPATGLGGILTLTLKNERIQPPISIKFKLPEKKEKKQKSKDSKKTGETGGGP